jgi:hypothetical protein
MTDISNKLENTPLKSFGPTLVKLTEFMGSWDVKRIQTAIRLVADDGGE